MYELRGTSACGSATCFELVATPRRDDQVTLFVDTTTSGLRKYFRRSRTTPQPISSQELEGLPLEAQERLATRSLEPFDVEETLEITPKFDVSVEETAFAYETTSQ